MSDDGAEQRAVVPLKLLDSYGLLPPIAVQTGPHAAVVPLGGGSFQRQGVIEVKSVRTRVWYLTNTTEGASGSPCCNLNWVWSRFITTVLPECIIKAFQSAQSSAAPREALGCLGDDSPMIQEEI